jgi:SPX domain protein involved in polyphosphate accumulation
MSDLHRYEIKFVLNDIQLSEVESWIASKTSMRVIHEPRIVSSLYMDDLDFSSVKDNLAGISNRQKFRLRWYGEIPEDFQPVFEIKGRNDRVGFKNTYPISSLNGAIQNSCINQVIQKCSKELLSQNYLIETPLIPTLQVKYLRNYFQDANKIRITLDSDISFKLPTPFARITQNKGLKYPLKILEIKFLPESKDKVIELISSLHLRPKRHSKYLAGLASLGMAQYL